MKTMKTILLRSLLIALVSCSNNSDSTATCATSCSYTLTASETAGTVPAALEGTFTLVYTQIIAGAPFSNNIMGTFTLTNNQLTVEIDGMDCITLNNPIQTSVAEVTFVDDCRDNLKYAVSVTTAGTLNEVNVLSTSNQFFGQFTE
jgi:hypothetical protein